MTVRACVVAQTPTHFTVVGPTAIVSSTSPLLLDGRFHDVQTMAKKVVAGRVTQYSDSEEVCVELRLNSTAARLSSSSSSSSSAAAAAASQQRLGGATDDDGSRPRRSVGSEGDVDEGGDDVIGVRVLDVFSLRSRVLLHRSTTVIRDGTVVAIANASYDLMETEDERQAAEYAREQQHERELTVRRAAVVRVPIRECVVSGVVSGAHHCVFLLVSQMQERAKSVGEARAASTPATPTGGRTSGSRATEAAGGGASTSGATTATATTAVGDVGAGAAARREQLMVPCVAASVLAVVGLAVSMFTDNAALGAAITLAALVVIASLATSWQQPSGAPSKEHQQ